MKDSPSYPMYRFLIMMTIASAVGLEGWRSLFNNFAVEQAGLEGFQVGFIQSMREVPGFLALLAVYALLIIKEYRLSAVSILIMGLGISAVGFFPNYAGLMITTLIMSFGFHYFETTNQSLALQYFDKKTSPWVFGKLRSFGAASNIAVGLAVLAMSNFLDYLYMFMVLGVILIVIGIWGFSQNPTNKDAIPQSKKMIFRKRYWLYYLLTFIAGARRQIFVVFSVFLMVKKFEFSLQEVTLLFIINNTINYFLSPAIGKAIIKYGERKVLSLEYFCVIFIFIAYGLASSKLMVSILYILDHIFYNFVIGIRTYFQKIADPKDIAPSMAVGFTINHIAAVLIPAMGGLLWMVDYRIPFFIGAGMGVISLIATQWMHTEDKVTLAPT